MKHNIWHIIILILVTVSAKIGAQDANNVTWKISWQANYGQYENLFRSYDIKCGCDIDRDGKGEILLNDGVTTKFLLLEAVQNDSFNVIWTIERPHQSTLRSLAVTDWDLDSLQEVSVIMDSPVGELPGAVYEWTGADNGLPTADAPTAEFDLPRNTDNAVCVEASSVLANLDGDPGPEWILPYFRGSGVSLVILELSTGSFADYGWDFDLLDTSEGQVRTVEAGDLDGDGVMEIVGIDRGTKNLRIYKNTGIDKYELINTIKAITVGDNYTCNVVESLRLINFDGGMPELCLLDDGGRMYIMTHKGNLASQTDIKFSQILNLSDLSAERGLAVGDLDRDGKPDLYFGSTIANKGVTIYDMEYEGGDVTSPTSYRLYTVWQHKFAFGGTLEVGNVRIGNQLGGVNDLDGDGIPELVVAFGTSQKGVPALLILENSSEPTKVAESPIQPEQCILQQNYPNPFNPVTQISYELARTAQVRLEIFSSLGQCVTTLVNEVQNRGKHTARYEATTLPSGLYFYRLTSDGVMVQKKMLLMK